MTAKTTIKNKNIPGSETVPDNSLTGKENLGWHGIKVGTRKSGYDIKLFKLLCPNPKQLPDECPLDWLLTPIGSASRLDQIRRWHRVLVRNRGSNSNKKLTRLATEIIQTVEAIELDTQDAGDALAILAACHAIRALAGNCELDDWTKLVARILQIAKVAESNVQLNPAVYQWLAIEVPLTIAFQIPEIEDYQQMGEQSCQKLALAVSEMLDTDGWPSAKYLSEFGPLAASWVRSTVIATKIGVDLMFESASQMEWMVRQVMRMVRPDGTLVFSACGSAPISDVFLDLLFQLTHDPTDKPLKRLCASGAKHQINPKRLPPPSNISEWAESAVLQSQWGRKSPRVAVDFSRQGCRAELSRSVSLLQGEAMPMVTIDGVLQSPLDCFAVVCSEQDDDIDYLELAVQLNGDATLTRQLLLSRDEEILLIADAVVPNQSSHIEYRCDWPLAAGIEGFHETETREVYLRDKKIQSLVMPLALPEWKAGRSAGRLDFDDGRMRLIQSFTGHGLYAPLFFDLNPKRSRKKRTWRQLTIGEKLQPVPSDIACAYRVQINQQQWVFYRRISRPGNRTFMGENFSGDFVFNRFESDGKVTALIEVQ